MENIDLPESSLNKITIHLLNQGDKEHAVIEARYMCARAGFGLTDQYLISTAVSELSTNILRYAGKGSLVMSIIQESNSTGIQVIAEDDGPGIHDIEMALRDNYTTTKGSLGLGLSSVRRIMDDLEIESSPGKGTKIKTRKWRVNDIC